MSAIFENLPIAPPSTTKHRATRDEGPGMSRRTKEIVARVAGSGLAMVLLYFLLG